jgi:hypothetical protein
VVAPTLEEEPPPIMPLDDVEKTGLLATAPAYPAETNEALTAAVVAVLLRLAVRAEGLAVVLLAL